MEKRFFLKIYKLTLFLKSDFFLLTDVVPAYFLFQAATSDLAMLPILSLVASLATKKKFRAVSRSIRVLDSGLYAMDQSMIEMRNQQLATE
jgi:hypothetical protein